VEDQEDAGQEWLQWNHAGIPVGNPVAPFLRPPVPSTSAATLSSGSCPISSSQPRDDAVFRFSHLPPISVVGRNRFPGNQLDTQSCNQVVLSLASIIVYVASFLTARDTENLTSVSSAFRFGTRYGDSWFTKPWNPLRRRLWGFGTPSVSRRTTYSPVPASAAVGLAVPIYGVLHFVWQFLSPAERFATGQTTKIWHEYISLRHSAQLHSVAALRSPRPPPDPAAPPRVLPSERARLCGCALLRFNFVYGDLIRWLSGEYTNRTSDWEQVFTELRKPPTTSASLPGLPPPDFARAFRIVTEGVPLVSDFVSNPADVIRRNEYDNHSMIAEHGAEVERKLAAEEEKSFHLPFPRFLVYFIPGIIVSPLLWVEKLGKGRICVDCTGGPVPDVAPNSFIPSPSMERADECPPCYYGSAWDRFLDRLWRLRLTSPDQDILLHCDDIDSAFRRVLYHPDLAPAFAYVFQTFLLVPVGQVFGARNAPSYFSLMSDIRTYVATVRRLRSPTEALTALASQAKIDLLPQNWSPSSQLRPAAADSFHQPLSSVELEPFSNFTFVDDNGVMAYRSEIREALHQSVVSAYTVFGFPLHDRRPDCMNDKKWDHHVSHLMKYLGFIIDSRAMTVTWPLVKRLELKSRIEDILHRKRGLATPRELSSILGKLRAAARIAPWGHYMTWSVQRHLRKCLRQADSKPRHQYDRATRTSAPVLKDLRLMCQHLGEEEFSPLWTRFIALLVSRDPTHELISDASYGGIGGWSMIFQIMWRVMYDDLVLLGFVMKAIDKAMEPLDPSERGLHINPLEFIGYIVNLWIALKLIPTFPDVASGIIVSLTGDNTTGLSWMDFATDTSDPGIRHLARLASTLLVVATSLTTPTRFQTTHIAGKLNKEADFLSRLLTGRKVPSWEQSINECSRLATCRICLLPRELLTSIASLLSCSETEVQYEKLTTSLMTLELVILPVGYRPEAILSTLQD